MKTAEDFLKEAIGEIRYALDGSVTKAQLKWAMEEYAKYYHEAEVKKLHKHVVMQAGSEKQPYFQLSTNEFDKHWLFYKPLKSEPGKYGCWMPIDDEFYSEFDRMQKAALGSEAAVGQRSVGTVAEAKALMHGICKERNCNEPATKDYNGHEHWVCDYHYDKLNDEFDEEYR